MSTLFILKYDYLDKDCVNACEPQLIDGLSKEQASKHISKHETRINSRKGRRFQRSMHCMFARKIVKGMRIQINGEPSIVSITLAIKMSSMRWLGDICVHKLMPSSKYC